MFRSRLAKLTKSLTIPSPSLRTPSIAGEDFKRNDPVRGTGPRTKRLLLRPSETELGKAATALYLTNVMNSNSHCGVAQDTYSTSAVLTAAVRGGERAARAAARTGERGRRWRRSAHEDDQNRNFEHGRHHARRVVRRLQWSQQARRGHLAGVATGGDRGRRATRTRARR